MTNSKIIICTNEEPIRETLKLILENECALILLTAIPPILHILENNADIKALLISNELLEDSEFYTVLQMMKKQYKMIKILSIAKSNTQTKKNADGVIHKPLKAEAVLATMRQYLK
jgi:DNA-binding NtrC family response regulator